VNVALGGAIALALHLAPESRWLVTKKDQAMDWMVRMHSGVSPHAYGGAPFLFLDIGEAAHRSWGEPAQIPRDRLRQLVEFGVEGGAAVVLVDVDLSRPGSGDAELRSYLERFATEDAPATHVVLARTFREPWPPDRGGYREERTGFLDPVVAAAPRLHWASTLFIRDSDRIIRRFRNFEPTCTHGEPGVVPAMQLLATALLLEGREGARQLEEAIRARRPPDCGGLRARSPARPASDAEIELGGTNVVLAADGLSNRILYSLAWSEADRRVAPIPDIPFQGRRVPLLTRIPAQLVTDSRQPLATGIAAGRIVVIGATHLESGDAHLTPLGEMPGPLIVTNATYSLLQHGGLRPPPAPVLFASQLALILLVSVVFAPLSFYWAMALAAPLAIAVMLPISFWLFRSGVWLDFAIPLGAVQIQAVVKKYMERYSELRSKLRRLSELEAGRAAAREPAPEGEPAPAGAEEPDLRPAGARPVEGAADPPSPGAQEACANGSSDDGTQEPPRRAPSAASSG
jgi:CHASE2 domain-containing sensor protein